METVETDLQEVVELAAIDSDFYAQTFFKKTARQEYLLLLKCFEAVRRPPNLDCSQVKGLHMEFPTLSSLSERAKSMLLRVWNGLCEQLSIISSGLVRLTSERAKSGRVRTLRYITELTNSQLELWLSVLLVVFVVLTWTIIVLI